ncbi:MAG: hypothetical protein ACTSUJ_09210 [Candidatus Njordarchaeales archaeon]
MVISKKLTSNDTLDHLLKPVATMDRIDDILSLSLNVKILITKILAMLNY